MKDHDTELPRYVPTGSELQLAAQSGYFADEAVIFMLQPTLCRCMTPRGRWRHRISWRSWHAKPADSS